MMTTNDGHHPIEGDRFHHHHGHCRGEHHDRVPWYGVKQPGLRRHSFNGMFSKIYFNTLIL